jgi:hypothetical protein
MTAMLECCLRSAQSRESGKGSVTPRMTRWAGRQECYYITAISFVWCRRSCGYVQEAHMPLDLYLYTCNPNKILERRCNAQRRTGVVVQHHKRRPGPKHDLPYLNWHYVVVPRSMMSCHNVLYCCTRSVTRHDRIRTYLGK